MLIYSYPKPPNISPGLIYFRKRFLLGLYKGGLISGGAYTWAIFCVSNKQVRHKQVSHKQENKHVLSCDYWAYINRGFIFGELTSGGLIFGRGGAYIWNEVSVSTCGGLIHGGVIFGGGLILGVGLIVGGLRYINTSGNWKYEKWYGNTTPEGQSVFTQFRVFPIFTSVDITVYQYG